MTGEGGDGGGGGKEEGGAGLWSGSTGPTAPGSAGGISAAPPCRRRSGHTQINTCSFRHTHAKAEEESQLAQGLQELRNESRQKNEPE